MSIKQQKNGFFLVHINKKGLPRVRKSFATRLLAEQFEIEYLKPLSDSVIKDGRTLKTLIDAWFMYHGVNLSDGERRRRCLDDIAHDLGNPIACLLTPEMFVNYRFSRLKKGLTAKTFNNHHGYLSAVFEKLRKLEVIAFDNPLAKVDYVKIQERQLSYLSIEQIADLFKAIEGCQNKSVYFVAQLCLRTGARWGEAEALRFKQLRDGRVTFEFTKSKRTRTVPLDADFYAELLIHARESNPGPNGRIFTNCIGSFRRAVGRAKLDLPTGQCSHILRHSFASHFMMNGGNILSLQKILGHADISMTMRYAHLAPDHLQDAIKFNPLSLATTLAN